MSTPGHQVVHIIQYTFPGAIEHTVTQDFLNLKMRDFLRKVSHAQVEKHDKPRVCIAGFMDYLWLRSYVVDYLFTRAPTPFEETKPLPHDFPRHFTFRGILVIEACENATGYTFA